MANYFYFIEVIKNEQERYHIIFKHHNNKRYSLFWLNFFQQLLQYEDLSFKCVIEGESLKESLSLTIKEVHNKESEKVKVM